MSDDSLNIVEHETDQPNNFVMLPRIAIRKLTPTELTLYSMYLDMCGLYGAGYKSNKTIASECELSVSTIKRARKTLENKGYIKVRLQHDGNGKINKPTYVTIINIWGVNREFSINGGVAQKEPPLVHSEPGGSSERATSNIPLVIQDIPPTEVIDPSDEKTEQTTAENDDPMDSIEPVKTSSSHVGSKQDQNNPDEILGYMPKSTTSSYDYTKEEEIKSKEKVFEVDFVRTYKANDPNTKRTTLPDTKFLYQASDLSTKSLFEIWLDHGDKFLAFIGQKIKLMSENASSKNGLSFYKQVVPPLQGKWLAEWSASQTDEAQVSLTELQVRACEDMVDDWKHEGLNYKQAVIRGDQQEGQEQVLELFFETVGAHYPESVKQGILGG